MNFLWNKITEWLKDMLISGIMGNLEGLFDGVNEKVAEIAGTVGTTPQAWNGSVFSMIKNISETVIIPIAGIILAFIMTYELIQMIIDKNSFHDFETFTIFKWVFKTFVAVLEAGDHVIKLAAVTFRILGHLVVRIRNPQPQDSLVFDLIVAAAFLLCFVLLQVPSLIRAFRDLK